MYNRIVKMYKAFAMIPVLTRIPASTGVLPVVCLRKQPVSSLHA